MIVQPLQNVFVVGRPLYNWDYTFAGDLLELFYCNNSFTECPLQGNVLDIKKYGIFIECLWQGIVLDTKKYGNFMQGLLQGNIWGTRKKSGIFSISACTK